MIFFIIWAILGFFTVLEFMEELRQEEEVWRQIVASIVIFVAAPFFFVSGIFITILEQLGIDIWDDP